MYFPIPWKINKLHYILHLRTGTSLKPFILHFEALFCNFYCQWVKKEIELKWTEFSGIPTYVQFDLRKVARNVAIAYVGGEWLYKATLSGVRHEQLQLTVNVWALRLYVFAMRTVLLYGKEDDIKMRVRLQVNTGSLFYLTNKVCYFLSALIA